MFDHKQEAAEMVAHKMQEVPGKFHLQPAHLLVAIVLVHCMQALNKDLAVGGILAGGALVAAHSTGLVLEHCI
jgi:hypothetical protein